MEQARLRIVRPLQKGSTGTSFGGILPLPGSTEEHHASGLTRRSEYFLVPPSNERLDAQAIGGMQEQLSELRVDVEALRSNIGRLTEMMQQILAARPPG